METDATEVTGPIPHSRWKTIVTLNPSKYTTLPIAHAPLLATGEIGELDHPISSILYPSGFRQGLLNSIPGGSVWEIVGAQPKGTRGAPNLDRLADDYGVFGALSAGRQHEIVSLLNCITEQRLVFPLLPAVPERYYTESTGGHVVYECARAVIRSRPSSKEARSAYERLIESTPDYPLKLAAEVQLCQNLVRVDIRPEEARDRLIAVQDPSREGESQPLRLRVMQARLERLIALVYVKLREFRGATEAVARAEQLGRELIDLTAPMAPYPRLVAVENLKITVESQVKFAAGQRDLESFARYSSELLDLDQNDPNTWRTISTYGFQLGARRESKVAALGQFGLSGTGVAQALENLLSAGSPADDEPLDHALLARLEAGLRDIFDPRFSS